MKNFSLITFGIIFSALLAGVPFFARADSASQPFTFQSLSDLITSQNVQTVDQLIPLLPDSYKKNFSLMVKSGSLQTASPASPRVIAFGSSNHPETSSSPGLNPDRLYIAFQTDSSATSRLPQSLEAIEWLPETRNYRFYQIDFPMTAKSVQTNPFICSSCHGDYNSMRPNWSAYPRWDGAIGSGNGLDGTYHPRSPSQPDEIKKALQKLQENNSRLASLDFTSFYTPGGLDTTNLAFSTKAGAQLRLRGVDFLRSTPDFQKFKYAFAGALSGCVNLKDFFDPATFRDLQNGYYANLAQIPPYDLSTVENYGNSYEVPVFTSSETSISQPDDVDFDKIWRNTSQYMQENLNARQIDVTITSWLRFLFEGRGMRETLRSLLGMAPGTPATYSAPATPGYTGWNYVITGVGSTISDLRGEYLLEWGIKDFPDVADLSAVVFQEPTNTPDVLPTGNNPNATAICQELSQKSVAALLQSESTPPANSQSGPALKQVAFPAGKAGSLELFDHYCAKCHTSGERPLPLDNLNSLKNYRMSTGEKIIDRLKNNEMPYPGAPQPTNEERQQMIDSLKGHFW